MRRRKADPRAAVRRALDLLERASEDWRGNGAAEAGALHWPVAVNLARRELRQALEALGLQEGNHQLPGNDAGKRPHILRWLARYGDDPRHAVHARTARDWLIRADEPSLDDCIKPRCTHCGGTGFQGDDPCEFCDASGRAAKAADARIGMAWFNSLTPAERAHWLEIADSAVPADAWRAFQAEGSRAFQAEGSQP